MADNRRTQESQLIHAPRQQVYAAFLEPDAVAEWLAPDTMSGVVHLLEPHVGGRFRMSLTYTNPADAIPGKSSDDTDTFEAIFTELIPNEMVVYVVNFDSPEPEFAGEMRMTWTLAEVDGATEVTCLSEGIPTGIRVEDNALGTRQSLAALADYCERG